MAWRRGGRMGLHIPLPSLLCLTHLWLPTPTPNTCHHSPSHLPTYPATPASFSNTPRFPTDAWFLKISSLPGSIITTPVLFSHYLPSTCAFLIALVCDTQLCLYHGRTLPATLPSLFQRPSWRTVPSTSSAYTHNVLPTGVGDRLLRDIPSPALYQPGRFSAGRYCYSLPNRGEPFSRMADEL